MNESSCFARGWSECCISVCISRLLSFDTMAASGLACIWSAPAGREANNYHVGLLQYCGKGCHGAISRSSSSSRLCSSVTLLGLTRLKEKQVQLIHGVLRHSSSSSSSTFRHQCQNLQVRVSAAAAPNPVHELVVQEVEDGMSMQVDGHHHDHEELVRRVRDILHSMLQDPDCAISSSPYDAGWVAMIPALDGRREPHFPAALEWVERSQLPDGSWAGDQDTFNVYDRLACTLSCVLALASWSRSPQAVGRGCRFIAQHLHQVLQDRRKVHRTVGFELVFSAMMERAQLLGLQLGDLPYQHPAMVAIAAERQRKLKQIPLEYLMSRPSTLLASLEGLEGLPGLDWHRVLDLAAPGGHMLSSPASTACVFMHTGDPKMLEYLTRLVDAFQGGVPNHSPMDMFEQLWVVDRLERLGIARFFPQQIKQILDKAHHNMTSKGLSWAADCPVADLDDTSMAFRLLRQHGYHVSADIFNAFRKGDKFSCWTDHGSDLDGDLTPAFNLYRASQTMFPGEALLEKAWAYTRTHLRENLHNKTLQDKWVMAKDMQGEVEYALSWPWYSSLPRIETRAYIEQYGVDDVWIAKTLYRMYRIQNSTILALAKADYNMCQRFYQKEVEEMRRWMSDSGFDRLGFARHSSSLLAGYLIMASCFFEPELAAVREAGTKASVVITMIDDYITASGASVDELQQFQAALDKWDPSLIDHSNERQRIVFMGSYDTINSIAAQASLLHGRDMSHYIIQEYRYWFQCCLIRAGWARNEVIPSWDEFVRVAAGCSGFLPTTIAPALVVPNHKLSHDVLQGEVHELGAKGDLLLRLLNDIRSHQRESPSLEVDAIKVYLRDHPEKTEKEAVSHLRSIVDSTMQEMVEAALRPKAAPLACTKVYLENAKMSYYMYADKDGWTSPSAAMRHHIHQLLYQNIP